MITIKVDATVIVQSADPDVLRRIEARVGQAVSLMREVLKATVKDPQELAKAIAEIDAANERMSDAMKPQT